MAKTIYPTEGDIAVVEGDGITGNEKNMTDWLGEVTGNFVDNGFTVPSSDADLVIPVAAGTAHISGFRVNEDSSVNATLTDNTTNHVYQKLTKTGGLVDGSILEVNTTGIDPADSVKLFTAITSAGVTTSTIDVRPLNHIQKFTGDIDFSTGLRIKADANPSVALDKLIRLQGFWNGTLVAELGVETGADTGNKDDGRIIMRAANAGGMTEGLDADEIFQFFKTGGGGPIIEGNEPGVNGQMSWARVNGAMEFHSNNAGSGTDFDLRFFTLGDANGEKMRIHSNGRIKFGDNPELADHLVHIRTADGAVPGTNRSSVPVGAFVFSDGTNDIAALFSDTNTDNGGTLQLFEAGTGSTEVQLAAAGTAIGTETHNYLLHNTGIGAATAGSNQFLVINDASADQIFTFEAASGQTGTIGSIENSSSQEQFTFDIFASSGPRFIIHKSDGTAPSSVTGGSISVKSDGTGDSLLNLEASSNTTSLFLVAESSITNVDGLMIMKRVSDGRTDVQLGSGTAVDNFIREPLGLDLIIDPKFSLHSSGRICYGVPNAAPTNADILNGQMTAHLDESATDLIFTIRDSGGTIRTITLGYV